MLESACVGYQRMWERQTKGEGKINRPERSSRLKRRHEKLTGKMNWFRRENDKQETGARMGSRKKSKRRQAATEGILYVPYTPQECTEKGAAEAGGQTVQGEAVREGKGGGEAEANTGGVTQQPNSVEG